MNNPFLRLRVLLASIIASLSLHGAALAQADADFADPLAELRAQIESRAAQTEQTTELPGAPLRPLGSSALGEAPQADAPAPRPKPAEAERDLGAQFAAFGERTESALGDGWTALNARSAALGERSGLGADGVMALILLAVLALAAFLIWLLFRRPAAPVDEDDIYEDDESLASRARHRRAAEPLAEVRAAREEDDADDPFWEPEPESRRRYAEQDDFERALATDPEDDAMRAEEPPRRRGPNLERLKASIRNDWFAAKSARHERDDAEAQDDDDLFGREADPDSRRAGLAAQAQVDADLEVHEDVAARDVDWLIDEDLGARNEPALEELFEPGQVPDARTARAGRETLSVLDLIDEFDGDEDDAVARGSRLDALSRDADAAEARGDARFDADAAVWPADSRDADEERRAGRRDHSEALKRIRALREALASAS